MRENLTERQVPSWAVTKLRLPELRDEIHVRPRLSAIFDQAIDTKEPLVLVSAPAGSGKSTAIASWTASRPELRAVWMQIDSADNDPVRFWTAFVAGLAAHEPQIQDTMRPLLQAPTVDFAVDILPALVNTLDQTGAVVIVLDDYHLIDAEQVHDDLTLLIGAAPKDVTIVVSSRHDPPLRLGRLRVRGRLREIRARELRFDADEASLILGGTNLTQSEIHTLCERAEGWAAGLVLAAVSLARSPDPATFVTNFAGDNRMVFDYLSTELWDTLDEPVQQFFLDISVLERMCGDVVDTLLDTSGKGAVWLERAAQDNQLIISLDDHGGWYRFHHLLQEQLQSRLQREDPDRFLTMHRKAAAWFANHDDAQTAIEHALAGHDIAAAARLVSQHGSATFSQGQLVTVTQWLDALGSETITREPWLAILRVWTLIVGGAWEQVNEPIQVAQRLLEEEPTGIDISLLRGSLVAARALAAIASGTIGEALSIIEVALDRPDTYKTTCLVHGIHGICLTWHGHHDRAMAVLEEAVQKALIEDEHLVAATALGFLAINACARGSHSQANHLAQQSIELAKDHGLAEYHHAALAHSVLGRTLVLNQPTEATEAGARGLALARRSNQPILMAFALVSYAEILTGLDNRDGAQSLLIEARHLLARCSDPGMVLTFLARTEARLGQPVQATATAPRIVDGLTPREVTIVRLLPSRLTIREIAGELNVSHNTVKGHLKAVYRKLYVHDRQTAVQRARELNLL